MLPTAVNFNGKIYNTIGSLKLNNGAFLVSLYGNELEYFDFTRIASLINNIPYEIKVPTGVEYAFMDYIKNTIQEKISNQQLDLNNLSILFNGINRYVNAHTRLLDNMRQLDGKDNVVNSRKTALLDYFAEEMADIPYFERQIDNTQDHNKENVEQQISMSQDNISDSQTNYTNDGVNNTTTSYESNINDEFGQTVEIPVQKIQKEVSNSSVASHNNVEFPEYNEETVSTILLNPQKYNININNFIAEYFNDFTREQIDLLLGNYNINTNQRMALISRKSSLDNTISEITNISNNNIAPKGHQKVLTLNKKDNKKAAFVDTLLLSFTIGTFCGVYLMYFILTIMS